MESEKTSFNVSNIKTLLLLTTSPETQVASSALDSLTRFADLNSKNRLFLLNSNLVNALLPLLISKDLSIKKSSIACIAAATQVSEVHSDMKRIDLIQILISLISIDEPPEVADEAAFALANCAVDFSNKALVRKYGGIKALISILDSPDPDVKKNSALALASVLEDCISSLT